MIVVAAGMVVREGRVLIARRPEGRHLAGKWEVPGGKLEEGESPEEALRRELREEMNIETRIGRIRAVKYFRYPEKDVLLLFYWAELVWGEPENVDCGGFAWARPEELKGYDFAPADAELIAELSERGFDKAGER